MIRQSRLANVALLFLATLIFLVFVSDDSEAATYTVDNLGGSDYTNITQAIDNASAGDTISVASRTYYDAVDVDKRLTLTGGNYGVSMGDLYYNTCNSGDLVTHYKFDQSSGDTAYDQIWCEDYNGDIEGASWTTGVWDRALEFDGNDYVEIAHDDDFNFTSAMSISAWINWDDVDQRQIIASTYTNVEGGSDRGGFIFRTTTDSKIRFSYAYSSDSAYCESESELDNDKWYLATAVFTDSSIQIYLNDELDNTCSVTDSMVGRASYLD